MKNVEKYDSHYYNRMTDSSSFVIEHGLPDSKTPSTEEIKKMNQEKLKQLLKEIKDYKSSTDHNAKSL